ncbi:MAG: enoyl-CoA hydratase/isomerase family protein [Melioribacteraceae bacterium]|nr:enoyl-CoA hydratase/isomerase family protein [Melioribacteraceae bacterium]MDD3557406.1 enoyl-CoA hydratase-related protein [Melioribacteraceae bacterium]
MDYNNILVEIDNKIALLTINREKKLNALNTETLDELFTCFSSIKTDDNVNVVVITGSGEKAFVAGADINELHEQSLLTGKIFAEKGQQVFNLIENLGKPVIAAVNGFALGGGCELALSCHIRLASTNAKFGQPEVNLGIIPGYGGTQRLTRIVGTGISLELILTGDLITADEAQRIGLVNKVIVPADLLIEAKKLAEKISSKGQIAVRAALASVLVNKEIPEREGLNFEANLFGNCCGSGDFKEGTKAFLEKRNPEFKNK